MTKKSLRKSGRASGSGGEKKINHRWGKKGNVGKKGYHSSQGNGGKGRGKLQKHLRTREDFWGGKKKKRGDGHRQKPVGTHRGGTVLMGTPNYRVGGKA